MEVAVVAVATPRQQNADRLTPGWCGLRAGRVLAARRNRSFVSLEIMIMRGSSAIPVRPLCPHRQRRTQSWERLAAR